MTNTTNYNFNLVEGTDLVNPLTQLNPNFTSLDSLLKGVSDDTITTATEVTSGTAHAISRTLPDVNVIRFVATSNWLTGDTMTIDGTSVTPLKTDGTTLKTGDYVIGASVILIKDGTRCTVYVASSPDASDINYDNTGSGLPSTKVQGAIDDLASDVATINSNLTVNTFGTTAIITGTTGYTAPHDGFLHVTIQASSTGMVSIRVQEKTLIRYDDMSIFGGVAIVSLFIRKGMVVRDVSTGTPYSLQFLPLE